MTSEMINEINLPAPQAEASRPPLICESCLRTQLSSSIDAPARLRARLMACLSANETPSTGAGSNALPPTGQKNNADIGRSDGPYQLEDLLSPGGAGCCRFVDTCRSGGVQADSQQRSDAIIRNVDPTGDFLANEVVTEGRLEPGRHSSAGLASPHHDDSIDLVDRDPLITNNKFCSVQPDGALHQSSGVHRIDTRSPDGDRVIPQ